MHSTEQGDHIRVWADLDRRTRNQVAVSMTLLQEFRYGCQQLFVHKPTPPHDDPPARFYKNALAVYSYAFFLAGPETLLGILTAIGMESHANGIRVILDERIIPTGEAKLLTLISDYRSKYLSHPTFTHEGIHKLVRAKYPEMKTKEGNARYQMLIGFLYDETAKLHDAMLSRFPEVRGHNQA